MYTEIDEPIKVGAVFHKTNVIPCWFIRQGQRHEIKEIAFSWQSRQGNSRILYFSVKLDKIFVD